MEQNPHIHSPAKPAPIKKAGFVIYARDANGEISIIAPYSEGRFVHPGEEGYKCYIVPKGSLDKTDRNAFEAAVRETYEETGIAIAPMRKPDGSWTHNGLIADRKIWDELSRKAQHYLNMPPEKKAKVNRKDYEVTNMGTSLSKDGLRLVGVSAIPVVDHTYTSHAGVEHRTVLYGIELNTLEPLRKHLKNAGNTNNALHYGITPNDMGKVRQNKRLPSMERLLTVLRTGRIEKADWNHHREMKLVPGENKYDLTYWHTNDEKSFRYIESKWLEERGIRDRKHIRVDDDLKEWKHFCESITGPQFKMLSVYVEAIKSALIGFDILKKDDTYPIKMDDKDFPLNFYQEGADILKLDEFFKLTSDRAIKNPHYLAAHYSIRTKDLGNGELGSEDQKLVEDLSHKVSHGQQPMMVAFARAKHTAIAPFDAAMPALRRLRDAMMRSTPIDRSH